MFIPVSLLTPLFILFERSTRDLPSECRSLCLECLALDYAEPQAFLVPHGKPNPSGGLSQ
jgi:hypothetical protein